MKSCHAYIRKTSGKKVIYLEWLSVFTRHHDMACTERSLKASLCDERVEPLFWGQGTPHHYKMTIGQDWVLSLVLHVNHATATKRICLSSGWSVGFLWLACNFSSLICPNGSAPAASKNAVLRNFSTFSPICIFFLLTLSLLWSSFFFSSLLWLFPPLLFHLSILSEVWLLNFLR